MQTVVFFTTANPSQAVAGASMDVPRQGEQVVLGGEPFNVAAVRYLVYPNNVVKVAVLLAPPVSADEVAAHYKAFGPQ